MPAGALTGTRPRGTLAVQQGWDRMTTSPLRYRGLTPVVDTTEAAEWDIAELGMSDTDLDRIALNLRALPVSTVDRAVGSIRIRESDGLDILFHIHREERLEVITICGLRRPTPDDPTEAILKRLGALAIIRGATGV